jgi:hypothetical protein
MSDDLRETHCDDCGVRLDLKTAVLDGGIITNYWLVDIEGTKAALANTMPDQASDPYELD